MNFKLSQSTQFKIKELSLITKVGTFDISSIFEELNIFDSILMPCMSGNILITDSLGLTQRLKFDGSEYIKINIVKTNEGNVPIYSIQKTFRIYSQTDRKNNNENFENYILNFLSE